MEEFHVIVDCTDGPKLAEFWCAALGYELLGTAAQYTAIVDPKKKHPQIVFQQVAEPKTTKNRVHFDYTVDGDPEVEAERVIGLGASRMTETPIQEHGLKWVTLQDPEGNEFCVGTRTG